MLSLTSVSSQGAGAVRRRRAGGGTTLDDGVVHHRRRLEDLSTVVDRPVTSAPPGARSSSRFSPGTGAGGGGGAPPPRAWVLATTRPTTPVVIAAASCSMAARAASGSAGGSVHPWSSKPSSTAPDHRLRGLVDDRCDDPGRWHSGAEDPRHRLAGEELEAADRTFVDLAPVERERQSTARHHLDGRPERAGEVDERCHRPVARPADEEDLTVGVLADPLHQVEGRGRPLGDPGHDVGGSAALPRATRPTSGRAATATDRRPRPASRGGPGCSPC